MNKEAVQDFQEGESKFVWTDEFVSVFLFLMQERRQKTDTVMEVPAINATIAADSSAKNLTKQKTHLVQAINATIAAASSAPNWTQQETHLVPAIITTIAAASSAPRLTQQKTNLVPAIKGTIPAASSAPNLTQQKLMQFLPSMQPSPLPPGLRISAINKLIQFLPSMQPSPPHPVHRISPNKKTHSVPAINATIAGASKFLGTFKSRILSNSTFPLLTLFTSWNENQEKHLVHNLTLINWRSLHPYVIPVVFTNESSVINECNKAGVTTLPLSNVAADGIPVLKYMFRDAMDHFNTSFYAFSNGDILFTDTLIRTLAHMIHSTTGNLSKPVLIVGRRTNVENVTFEEGLHWENITRISKSRGKLFGGWAEDYFITTPSYSWNKVAEVVIGRRAYDNWLVYNARKMKYTVIDATDTLVAVHQTTKAGNFEGHSHSNRDYNHNLLAKMYTRIPYQAGVVGCIEMYTQYDLKQFQVKVRKVPAYCSV
ncbi:uncharacterized protein LOC127845966 [Dreissena polymorpha]|uniref:uncharacterized protein LOC127845966 n=1 Tax=Dreissena polymorpha TaxID=45954 RepID=UPI002264F44A|nr:uncharacterized protein LOC127845966 [Dreissena polymorpha]